MTEDLFAEPGEAPSDLDSRLLFNQTTTALLLGISTQAFSKWNVRPRVRRGREALYYWPDVLAERDRRYYPEPAEPTEYLNLDAERARLAKEQADKVALENAVSRGELVHRTHMSEVLSRALGAFRARLLAAAVKLAPRVNPGNPNLARDLIEREHTAALSELADFDPGAFVGERESDAAGSAVDPPAAAEAAGQRVGRRRKKAE